ncbi:MAG TPA: magnesium/cobalt transporter CorA [Coleofasciculaceae cyanobacterium]|jgi:magnesium transporter
MSRVLKHTAKRSEKIGLPPGTPVYLGRKKGETTRACITVMEYDGELFSEREVASAADLLPLKPAPTVTWINVDGVHDEGVLAEFGETFHLHPLMLEDILNTDQRPKCEFVENMIYVILKMFDFDAAREEIITEQVSLVLGPNLLITFQEEVGDELEAIRVRLRNNGTRLRKEGADYLAYTLLDVIVDRYFLVLEKMGESLEEIELGLASQTSSNTLGRIHHIKREMIFLRKYVWPVREVVGSLQRSDTELLQPRTITYLRDVYDHTIQVMDTLETYRDLLGGIQDLYLSILSNRMNEIMKVLTVISTIFIPLTFIVGVYGMNFKYMPELDSPWGYPLTWLVMIAVAGSMVVYFRRKNWF